MKFNRIIRNSFSRVLFCLLMILAPLSLSAQESGVENASEEHAEAAHEKSGLNIKELIFSHICDSYSWHVCTFNDVHFSLPLPCIVYDGGMKVFMSSKLGHEGHYTEYEGLKIAEEGIYSGKIVRVSDGSRPLDFSITKGVLAMMISSGLMLWIFLSIAARYKENYWRKPSGMQAFLEPLIVSIEKDVIEPSVGPSGKKFTPYLLTVFFFILINNYLGLIPGGANLTGNITITLVLALLTFIITNVFATKHYWIEIFWPEVPTWLKVPIPLMPAVEIIGLFTKPFALCVRLFANMFAGHLTPIVLIGIIFMFAETSIGSALGFSVLSCLVITFLTLLECLVCFIQAYVFTLLSSIFIGLGQIHPHHSEGVKENNLIENK